MGSRSDEMDKYANKVEFILWDPTDEKQYQRMRAQRVACGWCEEEVPEWKDKVVSGEKIMYWIVLSATMPGAEKMLGAHMEQFPEECEPLTDAAASSPAKATFVPVGHTALEIFPERNVKFSLPASTYWIKSLYISRALRSAGIGRCAMSKLESLVVQPPYNSTVVALDTVQKEWQLSEASLQRVFEDVGYARPAELRTNEEWYVRQGYEIMSREAFQLQWPGDDGISELPFIYLKKTLV